MEADRTKRFTLWAAILGAAVRTVGVPQLRAADVDRVVASLA